MLPTNHFTKPCFPPVSTLQPALTAGLPPNLTSASTGDSLLMLASYHGHLPATKLLLSHGADPNRLNDRKQSPLSGAVFNGEEEIVEALLEGGADVDVGEPSAWRCLEIFGKVNVWGGKFEKQRDSVSNGGRVEGVGGMKAGTKIV